MTTPDPLDPERIKQVLEQPQYETVSDRWENERWIAHEIVEAIAKESYDWAPADVNRVVWRIREACRALVEETKG